MTRCFRCRLLHPVLVLIDKTEELGIVGAVWPHIGAVANAHEKVKVFTTIGDNVTLFQNIQTDQIKPDQMHSVLVQVVVILFLVPMVQPFVVGDYIRQCVQHDAEIPHRVALKVNIAQDFHVKVIPFAVTDR